MDKIRGLNIVHIEISGNIIKKNTEKGE